MESEADFETRASSIKPLKKENLTKWIDSIQDDSDESDISYLTCEETVLMDDRDIAKCAIAIAKANVKKGFVSICTYIARILKQNAKLRKEVHYLRTCPNDAERLKAASQDNKSGSFSKSASGSFGQISGIIRLPLKDKNSKTVNVDIDNSSDTLNTSPTSQRSDKTSSKEHEVLTQAIVHRSRQFLPTDLLIEFSPIHDPARSQQSVTPVLTTVDESGSQEKHQSEIARFESFNTSPKNMFSRVGQGPNKSRSPNGNGRASFGSPRLSNIYEDMPLDVACLTDPCVDQTAEDLPNASNETGCKEDSDEQWKDTLQWSSKYLELYQRFKNMELERNILREKLNNQGSPVSHPSELLVTKTDNTDDVKEPKFISVSTSTEEQMSDDTNNNIEPDWLTLLMQQNLTPLMAPSPLKGCKCTNCELAVQEEVSKAVDQDEIEVFELMFRGRPLLEVSAHVMIPGNTIARVMYVGHLDSTNMPSAVFVGVTVAKPIGNSNGRNGRKQYFNCPPKHGIFMPINQILFVVSPATDNESDVQKKVPLRKQRSNSHPGNTS